MFGLAKGLRFAARVKNLRFQHVCLISRMGFARTDEALRFWKTKEGAQAPPLDHYCRTYCLYNNSGSNTNCSCCCCCCYDDDYDDYDDYCDCDCDCDYDDDY